MKLIIETIPHADQRYPTVGDWTIASEEDGSPVINIRVSREVGDWRAQALVAMHEAIEALLCIEARVTQSQVDAFDMAYEKDREAGNRNPEDEPGDDPCAPYYKQHQIATGFERILAAELKVYWNTYAAQIELL